MWQSHPHYVTGEDSSQPRYRGPVFRRLAIVALFVFVGPTSPAVAALTKKEIRAAVRRATRSPSLWATVNICNSHTRRIGIRAQMPSLGFTTRLYMKIEVEAFFTDSGEWHLIQGAIRSVNLGNATHSTLQNGFTFGIDPAATAFLLRGAVTFSWKRNGEMIGRTTKITTKGHKHDLGARGRASCTI
jgi:hypothetical protein